MKLWGTPHIASTCFITELLTATLWMLPSNHPSNSPSIKPIALHFSGTNIVGDYVKDLTEVQTDDISSSSIVCWCSHPIIEGHWISQAQYAHGESMLAISNYPPVFHMHWHIFQEDLPHDTTRHWGEAGCSVVPRVILITLLENGCNIPFSSHWGFQLTAMTFLIWWRMS